jgi:hypothetical protein
MGPDRLQLQRLELKYLISEQTALGVRDFVRSYLELDEYGLGKPNNSYAIHSLYLDSDELRTYWDTINGNKNRFKLRLRYYDDKPDSPVFFEIKRRMNEAILKKRGGVKRRAVHWLLSGQLPDPSHLLSNQPKHLDALQKFCHLMIDIQARPKAHVSYLREAWVSTQDNSVRVTMDRQVRIGFEPTAQLTTQLDHHVMPFEPEVILELKFTGRFPNWFRDIVQVFGLTRVSAAKYAEGVCGIGEEVFRYRQKPANGSTTGQVPIPEYSIDNNRQTGVETTS